MSISSKSIIHYTKTEENLKSILLEGFKIKYCCEDFHNESLEGSLAAHPMVCFSDIPLSISYSGNWTYGDYAIGLTKAWAISKKLNPVLYLENNSLISDALAGLLKERRSHTSKLEPSIKSDIMKLKCFTKNYIGYNSSLKEDDYNFYNEREWRFVPDKDFIGGNNISINQSSYKLRRGFYNKNISSYRLPFSERDISFIIVRNERQISRLINFIQTEFKKKHNTQKREIDILISKITSASRIRNDY